jgi:hypothetical protein
MNTDKTTTRRALSIAMGIAFCVTIGRGQEEKLVKYRGRYSNVDYGFSVVIPNGLVGEGNPPHAPNHGFAVSLHLKTAIRVDASYEMPDSPHEFGAFNSRLGSLKAERRSWQDSALFHEAIVARGFDRESPIIYTIEADGEPARKTEALRVFRALVSSFQTLRVRP